MSDASDQAADNFTGTLSPVDGALGAGPSPVIRSTQVEHDLSERIRTLIRKHTRGLTFEAIATALEVLVNDRYDQMRVALAMKRC